MRRSPRSVVFALALLIGTHALAPIVAGADPTSSRVERVTAGGAVVLANGRVLPPAPPGTLGPSEMAHQLTAHANDRIAFKPGAVPRPRAADPAVLTLADPTASRAELLSLAPAAATTSNATLAASLPNGLRKQVFGFLPYWMLNASDLQWMRYGLVSTIAYFGVAARSNGTLATSSTGWSGWNSSAMTGVINAAHAKGARVVIGITMMAWDSASAAAQATLLKNATYRSRLVNTIVAAVRSRNADGVNLDFEPLATSLRSQYTALVRQLKAALVGAHVGSYLTICTTAGAATWATGYDLAALTASGAADGIFAMGYDYSWSGSSRAGGVAPMESSYMLDVNQSVTDFLSIIPGSKLIWGVPYYGRTWRTASSALNAPTVPGASGYSKAYYYTGAKALAAAHGRRWDSLGQVPWFVYYDGTARHYVEGYYDDVASLGVKYDMINRRGLAGVGMWHLLMDAGVSDLWNLLANKFQRDTVAPSGGIANLPPTTDAYVVDLRWRAIDVGAGLGAYTVQVRDRASPTWTTLLQSTGATSATYLGTVGHAYEFRVAARDRLGNTQPWQPAMASPGGSLAVHGFATVNADALNVRAGAGTGFESLVQLTRGARLAIVSGPVSASGYQWYQVQFAFNEWPSADYPRTGWAAAGDGSGPFLVPAVAPTVTTVAPWIGGYAPGSRSFSPNGDGIADTAPVSYSLPAAADQVRLDVLNPASASVASLNLGAQVAGSHAATWDGRTGSGSRAAAGRYTLRVVATAGGRTHYAPASSTNTTILGRWGVSVDLTPPSVSARGPSGAFAARPNAVTATFSEPIMGVSATTFSLVDLTRGVRIPASVTWDAASRTASLHPGAVLAVGHTYRAVLNSAIRDVVGNPMRPTSWTFTTVTPVTTYSPARSLVFQAGTTTGYKFDASGRIVASHTAVLSRTSGASTNRRSRAIPGRSGAWFSVVNGVWAGYWVPESPRVFLPGVAEVVPFRPQRTVAFASGLHTAYRFSGSWQVNASRPYTLGHASSAATDRSAVINGRGYLYQVNGVWAGYWMPVGGGVTLR